MFVSKSGIKLIKIDGKVLGSFPLQRIQQWGISAPGTFKLQVVTGEKVVGLVIHGDEDEVVAIIDCLERQVAQIIEDSRAEEEGREPQDVSAPPPRYGEGDDAFDEPEPEGPEPEGPEAEQPPPTTRAFEDPDEPDSDPEPDPESPAPDAAELESIGEEDIPEEEYRNISATQAGQLMGFAPMEDDENDPESSACPHTKRDEARCRMSYRNGTCHLGSRSSARA